MLKKCCSLVQRVQPLLRKLLEKQGQTITDRLFESLTISSLNASDQEGLFEELIERIQQEVMLYSLRIDIVEELERLQTHLL